MAVYDNALGYEAGGQDGSADLVVAPDGQTVYAAGDSADPSRSIGFVIVATDAEDGTQRWATSFAPQDSEFERPATMAISPDGSKLFVTGWSAVTDPGKHLGFNYDYLTIAVDTSNGDVLWSRRFDGAGADMDLAWSVVADDERAYISGRSAAISGHPDMTDEDAITIAYDAVTGEIEWKASYDYEGGSEQGIALAVDPIRERVFVVGLGKGDQSDFDVALKAIAYDSESGELLWDYQYDGGGSFDAALALAVAPDGSRLFVAGQSSYSPANYRWITVGVNASDGTEAWQATHRGETEGFQSAYSIATDPNGERVYVTGSQTSSVTDLDTDIATIAYDSETGAIAWSDVYGVPTYNYEWPHEIVVAPDGAEVYVVAISARTATNGDFTTLAYDTVSGAQNWAARYNGAVVLDRSYGWSLGVAPDSSRVFTSGIDYRAESQTMSVTGGPGNAADLVTVSYSTGR